METLLRRIDTEISAAGGKRSKSRQRVIELFFRAGTHVTVEELTRAARRTNRNVGTATVYRTLKLLARLGYATEHDFGEGVRRYENNLSPHHDHFVCSVCGEVSEFEEPGIEALQDEVARRHGFRATAHRLDIFGCCSRCAPAGSPGEPR